MIVILKLYFTIGTIKILIVTLSNFIIFNFFPDYLITIKLQYVFPYLKNKYTISISSIYFSFLKYWNIYLWTKLFNSIMIHDSGYLHLNEEYISIARVYTVWIELFKSIIIHEIVQSVIVLCCNTHYISKSLRK